MYKTWKIRSKKIQFKRVYQAYLAELNSMSCGGAVAEYINPRISELRRECNARLDELRALDPTNCPSRIA